MKNLKQILNTLAIVFILISLASCSGGTGGENKQQQTEGNKQQQTEGNKQQQAEPIKQLQTEVNGSFNEYFQVIDNAKKIDRIQDGESAHYEFTVLIKVKKPFICKEQINLDAAYVEEKLMVHLKFYGEDKKQLPINGKNDLTFEDIAVSDGGSICYVIGKPKGTETWFTFKTINFVKESQYFIEYPASDVKYFTIESGY